ncbi:hypothetical protein SLITO_v1c06130 [Spiroplasma litorale]|uniref:Uncharacterized protein n=1 Tax=Spiroplasma litorale TaxID=216942 RepID=A0A0K1W2C1_9MOLU|nr:hypothetical protein [Spiroplasma litorale]AKX34247.1 hypothetical protein SLITO_v1c06130 [Spiroplasma litorale]
MKKDFLFELEKTIFKISQPNHINYERSSKKVDILHYAIHRHLSLYLDKEKYKICSKVIDKKEYKVEGLLFDKKADIAILNVVKNKVVATIELKLYLSSVQKNLKNSLSNMIGETANIQLNDIKTFWILNARSVTPVYDESKKVKSFYKINQSFFDKYLDMYNKIKSNKYLMPSRLLINVYDDNLDIQKFSSKREILQEINNFEIKNNFNFRYDNNYIFNDNKLYVNCYDKFIKKICEEIMYEE